jgi:hypothetical protein
LTRDFEIESKNRTIQELEKGLIHEQNEVSLNTSVKYYFLLTLLEVKKYCFATLFRSKKLFIFNV